MEGAFGDTLPIALFQVDIPFQVGPELFRDRRVRDEGLILLLGKVVQLLPAFDLLCKVRPEAIIQAALADPCMKANPVKADASLLEKLLEAVTGRG